MLFHLANSENTDAMFDFVEDWSDKVLSDRGTVLFNVLQMVSVCCLKIDLHNVYYLPNMKAVLRKLFLNSTV